MALKILFTIFITFLTSLSYSQIIGYIVKVKDGDTYVIESKTKTYTVRLNSIDAPEKDQDFGIESKQLILDPGIGFGKQPSQSLCILNRIGQLKEFGLPLLVGHSRKGFLKLLHVGSMAEMDFNTGIVSAYLTDKKVEHIRVHNVLLNKKLIALRKFMVDRNDGKSMGVLEAVALCLKNL